MALTYVTYDRERKEKVRLRSRLWPICQSRHYLTPNTIEASASSEKKEKKIQYPVPCQKYPRQDAKKSGLTA